MLYSNKLSRIKRSRIDFCGNCFHFVVCHVDFIVMYIECGKGAAAVQVNQVNLFELGLTWLSK